MGTGNKFLDLCGGVARQGDQTVSLSQLASGAGPGIVPGFQGRLPLELGVPVVPGKMLPEERAGLEALGWKEGDAIPSNLPDILDQIRREAVSDPLAPPVPLDTPPVALPKSLPISDLPPAKLEEVKAVLRQTAEYARDLAAQQRMMVENAPPGVNEAISASLRDPAPPQMVGIIDDRPAPATQPAGQTPVQTPVQTQVQTQLPAADPAAQPDGEGPLHRCPNCAWELSRREPAAPTDADKLGWLAGLILGEQGFYKTYELAGGMIRVTFRNLRMPEIDACNRAVYKMPDAAELLATGLFSERVLRYQLYLSLKLLEFRRPGQPSRPLEFPEQLADWRQLPGGEKVLDLADLLPMIEEQMLATALRDKSLLSICAVALGRFNHIIRRMEDNAENADFWQVEQPR